MGKLKQDRNLGSGRLGGALNAIEWIGNKLPDPAILFLIGLFAVLVASHLVAPRLPDGFEVRWTPDTVGGGVDEQRGVIGRVVTDPTGVEVGFDPAEFRVAEGPDGSLEAHLVIVEGEQPVVNDAGVPVDMSERGWAVFEKRPVETVDPETGEGRLRLVPTGGVMFARSLLTSDGWYWLLSSMEANFLGFAPLGVVLLGMLGIGPMEKVGLISALLRTALARVPDMLLTPAMVFLGIMSSLGSDAGYVVLPPLAALAYLACGRSPLAGIAAVFAGVSAGFNANLLITSLEPLMSNLSQAAAQTIDPGRAVAATSAWYFMIASTFVLTFAGWATTAVFVEKRLARKSPEDGGPDLTMAASNETLRVDRASLVPGGVMLLAAVLIASLRAWAIRYQIEPVLGLPEWWFWSTFATLASIGGLHLLINAGRSVVEPAEYRGLIWSSVVFGVAIGVTVMMVYWEGSPLYGIEGPFPRWVAVIVPLMFILTILPAMVYGALVGVIKDTKDATRTMIESMAAMAPIIVLAFFAGQFVSAFEESGLGRMLAFSGGEWLFEQRFPAAGLVISFIFVTMIFNLFIGSMSAKYALFAPIFVPMFMLIGIRPELTQTAYRIGDSTTNIITPLNAYLIIVLMYVQKYAPKAGIGTLIAMMLPYTVVFTLVWIVMILVWMWFGLPLGPGDLGQPFSEAYMEMQTGG